MPGVPNANYEPRRSRSRSRPRRHSRPRPRRRDRFQFQEPPGPRFPPYTGPRRKRDHDPRSFSRSLSRPRKRQRMTEFSVRGGRTAVPQNDQGVPDFASTGSCVGDCQNSVLWVFYKIGYIVGSYPIVFLALPLLVCIGFAIGGFVSYDADKDSVDDPDKLYVPKSARIWGEVNATNKALPDRVFLTNYDPFSVSYLAMTGDIIVRSKATRAIFDTEVIADIKAARDTLFTKTKYERDCAKINDTCAVGDYGPYLPMLFTPGFATSIKNNEVTYPVWRGKDLEQEFGKVQISNGKLKAAGSFKMTFPVGEDGVGDFWLKKKFEPHMKKRFKLSKAEFAFSHTFSLADELSEAVNNDIPFFVMTFGLMVVYTSLASSGGNCVSARTMLAVAGVLSALLGICGALGMVVVAGQKFSQVVGFMPFLLLGVGVDDMFLIMNCWSETFAEVTSMTLAERIGVVYMKAGLGITITSLTNFLAFMVGTSSDMLAVEGFCVYTGVGVLLSYVNAITFFGACLTFHGKRVSKRLHTITCDPVPPMSVEDQDQVMCCCLIDSCSGDIPHSAEDDQSPCEKGPRGALEGLLTTEIIRYAIMGVFCVSLGVSCYGITLIKEGLELKNLAASTSYFYKFKTWETEDFGSKIGIAFVKTTTTTYNCEDVADQWKDLMTKAQKDPKVSKTIDKCWLTAFCDNYNITGSFDAPQVQVAFQTFLAEEPKYVGDLFIDEDAKKINASRCFVYSEKITEQEGAKLMIRMREVADASPLKVFAYNTNFTFYEQYNVVKKVIIENVGITLVVMLIVTSIFLPNAIIIVTVMSQVVMIVIGIFGWMGILGIPLSSVTMITLLMAVGFSVDFCVHVCSAFLASKKPNRQAKALETVVHASGPILNGGATSLLGVFVLVFSKSNIFFSFFQIMSLVVVFGTLHAVFLIPVILYTIGPQ